MPRGFKRDTKLTKRLRDNGLLLDKRSFIGYDTEAIPHLLLYGEDIKNQRERVFHKAGGKCAVCRQPTSFGIGEMDHKQGGTSGRCDCDHNLQWLCYRDHQAKHNRYPKFGSGRTQAIADFIKVNL